ncbi:MAG: ABC transporter permease [Acidobacteriota bacterium]|nr:ABC transporter permease [Acidobacteriota bacterium]
MRFYRALLHLYPKSFRAEYGDEVLAVIAERRAAARGFGRVSLVLQTFADTLGTALRVHADVLCQDLRYSIRTLRRSPAFTLTAILLTSVGIGATTAAFAIADHVLLRPLPYAAPDRLVRVWQEDKVNGGTNVLSPGNYRDFVARASALALTAAYTPQSANLVGEGAPVRLEGQRATGELFDVLGRSAARGRVFTAADARETSAPVVVLSHRAWTTHFAGDPAIVGRAVTLNGTPHAVIGVMPLDFMFPDRATEFWAPLWFAPQVFNERDNTYLWTVARLRDGRSLEQADAELDAAAADLARQFPNENARLGASTVGLRGNLTAANRTMIAGVAGAAVCLLLIASTNLAGLLLSRGLSRQREMAVRAAIGAGRERLVRQLLTESFVLASAGGVLGTVLAVISTPLLARLVPNSLPIADTPSADLRFIALGVALALITAIAFGVLPARRAAAASNPQALRESARTGSGKRTETLRGALVIAQVAASVVLLVSVGLLGQALWRIQGRHPGFDASNVLTLRTSLPWPKYAPAAQRVAFYERVTSEIQALPGVEHAGYITGLPMAVGGQIWAVQPEGAVPVEPGRDTVGLRFATPGYFDAMRIPIREGRNIAASDTRDAPFVAVVSQSFAERFWPGRSAVGRRFKVAFFDRLIVGVAGDVRVRGPERTSEPQVYLPPAQVPDGGLVNAPPKDLAVRANVPPATLLPAIRRIIARADTEQPISNVRLLEEVVHEQIAPRATQARVLGGFAAIAMLLAAIGLYGLLAFAVSRRTRELGLRMALGATPSSVIALVVKRGLTLALAGVAIGAAAAYGAGRWMESLLDGVSPHDVTTFGAAIVLTTGLALLGTILPALRAARISPLTATRNE